MMPVVTPLPGRGAARPGGAVPEALAIVALIIPMMIAVAAVAPVLLIGPFLSAAHQRFVLRLLGSLSQWSLVVVGQASRDCRQRS